MKALELVVYPKNSDGDYLVPLTNGKEMLVRYEQADGYGEYGYRLTDAELAAEYWAQYAVMVREAANYLHAKPEFAEAANRGFMREERLVQIIGRFAKHPHYDEADS